MGLLLRVYKCEQTAHNKQHTIANAARLWLHKRHGMYMPHAVGDVHIDTYSACVRHAAATSSAFERLAAGAPSSPGAYPP
jgi:hypothetical protein